MGASHRDYVPRNPAQFFAFMRNLTDYVGQNFNGWGN